MALTALVHQETNLIGRVVNTAVTAASTTIYVQFTDSKTGVARTPQSTTLYFTFDKDNERFEIIKFSSHTTTGGVTTLTVATNGRAMPLYGIGAGSASGNTHPIGSQVGCVDIHWPYEVLNNMLSGTEGTNALNFRIGNETDSDITLYAQNADANKPYVKYDKTSNKWIFSNDGTSSTDMGGGTGTITAGDGIDIAAGVVSTDLKTSGGLKITATELETDLKANGGITYSSGLMLDLTHNAFTKGTLSSVISDVTATAAEVNKLSGASANVTNTNLNTLTAGSSSDASSLHTHTTLDAGVNVSLTTGEAIDGSTTKQAVAIAGTTFKAKLRTETAADTLDFWDGGGGLPETTNMGNVDANAKFGQSFTFTDADATTITIEKISLMIGKVGAPTDNVFVTIMTDNAGVPSNTVITNGTSQNVAGAGVSTANEYALNTFTFATPPTITSGTTYHIVVQRSTALDAANYYRLGRWGSSLITGAYTTQTGTTTVWSAGSANDLLFDMRLNVSYAGKSFKADADNFSKCKFVGMTASNVAGGGTAVVQTAGVVTMSSLTPGATYYVSDTAGGITAAPSGALDKCLIPVGEALSATQLLINRGLRVSQAYYATLRFSSTLNTTTVTADIFTETGFKPIFVRVSAYCLGDANEHGSGRYEFVYGDVAPDVYANLLNASNQTVTAQTEVLPYSGGATTGMGYGTSNYIKVSNIYENGFDLRYVSNDTDHYFRYIRVTAYGY